ncbi:MAG: hypothetical protein ACREAR_00560 [Nitrosotalea sp.]
MQPAIKNSIDKKLNPDLESLLKRVETGKEPMTRRKNIDEFIKDINKITSEE